MTENCEECDEEEKRGLSRRTSKCPVPYLSTYGWDDEDGPEEKTLVVCERHAAVKLRDMEHAIWKAIYRSNLPGPPEEVIEDMLSLLFEVVGEEYP